MGKINTKLSVSLAISLFIAFISFKTAGATCSQGQQSCSSNYGVGSTFFGGGGALDSTCSPGYCAKQSLGETGQGLSASPTYQTHSGFNVDREPYLQLIVNPTSLNLGTLTTSSTATGTATFSVKDYLSGGYSIITTSPPPEDVSYTLSGLLSPTVASHGSEQFGINLVQNLTTCTFPAPANFGANPVQIPSGSFSYGAAGSGYSTCGLFKYVQNDTIAGSTVSSGETDFTISYIADIKSTTPAGVYSMSQVLVALPSY